MYIYIYYFEKARSTVLLPRFSVYSGHGNIHLLELQQTSVLRHLELLIFTFVIGINHSKPYP